MCSQLMMNSSTTCTTLGVVNEPQPRLYKSLEIFTRLCVLMRESVLCARWYFFFLHCRKTKKKNDGKNANEKNGKNQKCVRGKVVSRK